MIRILLFILLILTPSLCFAQPQRIERNVARSKATLALAEAEKGWKDGELVNIRGFATENDGSGQPMVYHKTGWAAGGYTEGPWYQRIGSTDAYFEAVDKNVANVLWAGADRTGSADSTSAVQACVDAAASRTKTDVFFPPGVYRVNNIDINEADKIQLRGTQSLIIPVIGATVLFDIDVDFNKDHMFTIKGLSFSAYGNDGVTAIKLSHAATNMHIEDCSFGGFDVGLNGLTQYNLSVDNCVFSQNDIGILLRGAEDGVLGVSNANSFDNCEIYANVVGFAIYNGGAQNYFDGCVIQNNTICGVAAYDQDNIVFDTCHFEANGGTSSSVTIDGKTVQQSNTHANNSEITYRDCLIGDTSAGVKAENDSTIIMSGRTIYSGPALVDDLDDTSKLITHAATLFSTWSQSTAMQYGPLPIAMDSTFFNGFGTKSEPIYRESYITNDMPEANQQAPQFYNQAGIDGLGSDYDSEFGSTTYIDFAASVGSTSTNRALLNLGFGTVNTNDRLAFTVLVKASAETGIVFRIGGAAGQNQLLRHTLPANKWVKIVMTCRAASVSTSPLWVYPEDDVGAVVQFCKPMSKRIAFGESYKDIEEMLINFAYSSSRTENRLYRGTGDTAARTTFDNTLTTADSWLVEWKDTDDNRLYTWNGSEWITEGGYAQISTEDNATATTVASTQSDWSAKSQFVGFSANASESRGATPDHTNDHITITSFGVWEVQAVLTLSGSVASDLWELAFFVDNGALQVTPKQGVNIISAGFTYSNQVTVSGIATFAENDTVELWVQRTNGTGTLTITNAVMTATKVSD